MVMMQQGRLIKMEASAKGRQGHVSQNQGNETHLKKCGFCEWSCFP